MLRQTDDIAAVPHRAEIHRPKHQEAQAGGVTAFSRIQKRKPQDRLFLYFIFTCSPRFDR